MRLNGAQREQLCNTLLDAFPSYSKLEQLVSFGLDENLEKIASRGENLKQVVFTLVRWAESSGKLEELIRKAHKDRPGNEELKKFVGEFEGDRTESDLGELQIDYKEFSSIISRAEEEERLKAVRKLQKLATPEARKILCSVAQKNDSVNVRVIAIQALGEIGDESVVSILNETIRDQKPEVRAAFIRALGKIGNSTVSHLLREFLNDSDATVRVAVIRALGKIKDPEAQFDLIQALSSDDSPEVRNAAMTALE